MPSLRLRTRCISIEGIHAAGALGRLEEQLILAAPMGDHEVWWGKALGCDLATQSGLVGVVSKHLTTDAKSPH